MRSDRRPIAIIAGTRPELIKLAPVYREFLKRRVPIQLWLTGQHTSLSEAPIEFFGLKPDLQWDVLRPGQSQNVLLAKLLGHLDEAITRVNPAAILVQGDTTSALAGGVAGFHRQIPVAHVEAGLRTGDLAAPFPEEMNRRVIDSFARWLFAPTVGAARTLKREGHRKLLQPTGNTGIDALLWAREKIRSTEYWPAQIPKLEDGQRLILSTGHRRENLGEPMKRILTALGRQIKKHPDLVLIHANHPNPAATQSAAVAFKGIDRVYQVPALSYPDFVALLDRAALVVSDSGGIQEEAPSFGVPVLITREVTERPEVLKAGGRLVGTDPVKFVREFERVLKLKKPSRSGLIRSPFGDGRASSRIVNQILKDLKR